MRTLITVLALVTLLAAGCASGPREKPPLPPGANATCPVMGEDVDPGLYTEYRGRKIFFCCENCRSEFEARPDYYLERAYPDAK